MITSFLLNKKLVLLLFIVTVLCIFSMRFFDAPLKNDICKSGIISFELAKDLSVSEDIMDSWNERSKVSASLSMGFDFLFLLVYSSFIGLLIFRVRNKMKKDHFLQKLGKILIYAIFLAALFDVIENIALIKLLLGDLKQIWSSLAYYFAIPKFLIVLICIVYILLSWLFLLFRKNIE